MILIFMFILLVQQGILGDSSYDDNTENKDCGEYGDCVAPSSKDCNSPCGCEIPYDYIEETQECMLNWTEIFKDFHETKSEETINEEADRIFIGILVAALLFVLCTVIGLVAGCYYCVRIHYSDLKLNEEIAELTKKHGNGRNFKGSMKKSTLQPVEESCNVVVGGAGKEFHEMMDLDVVYVFSTLGIFLILCLIFLFCCFCAKLKTDLMRLYVLDLATQKGIDLDINKIHDLGRRQSNMANENCTIFVPDVAIIM